MPCLNMCWIYFTGNMKYILIFYHSPTPRWCRYCKILPVGRQGPFYPVYSIPWLLMVWWHKEPEHQQVWYWPRWSRNIPGSEPEGLMLGPKCHYRSCPHWGNGLLHETIKLLFLEQVFVYFSLVEPNGIIHTSMLSWWHHQMEPIFCVTGPLCWNSPVNSLTKASYRSFDVFFDLRLNKRLSKQLWGWSFETPSHPLWHYCNVSIS